MDTPTASRPGFLRRTAENLGLVTSDYSTGVAAVRETSSTAPVPPARPTAMTITPETALGIGAVYRSVSIIIAAVSSMDLGVFRGPREIATPALVRRPNVTDSTENFVQETVASLATHGNAFWRVTRATAGAAPSSLAVLDPERVTVVQDPDTYVRTYYVHGAEVPPSRIRHLQLMRRPGQAKGLGPIQAATGELTGALLLRKFADEWFDTREVPTGFLTTDLVLSPQESEEFSKSWKRFIKENGVPVLSQGLSYNHLRVKPAEAQFLEVQRASVAAIARLFGIPAMHLLAEVEGTSNTYLNLEQANLVFLQSTLSRYMTEIETALSDLLPGRARVRFKTEGLLRLDASTLWKVRKIQHETGARTTDEIRAEDGLEPSPTPAPQEAPRG